ncbi:hypothetical protein [Rhodopirellula sp. MGV]|uniref:hypothetical protein n=1 Tax=Rhodopirellula sp. MGV TaxID=2023130 RepID=UPI000B9753D1|nr:hypothetical protein [Rhodopirellula sp. MGV]OYP35710.1 hypothetical protein CGZ80_11045 [Rhodopirellula sp. MGV]PNY35005.1 hypothetical protein C2E31_20525 [Rhodopirellula baltica]
MAGDLEDFLKRAAERRAQKQRTAGNARTNSGSGQRPHTQGSQQRQKRQAPQYTNSRRERQVRVEDDEPILLGEPIEVEGPLAAQQQQLAISKRRAEDARKRISEAQRSVAALAPGDPSEDDHVTENPIEELLQHLSRPGGAQQAFLLNEILTRPNWDDL